MLLTGSKPASAPVQAAQAAAGGGGEPAAAEGRGGFSEALSRHLEESRPEAASPDATAASDGAPAPEGEGGVVGEESPEERDSQDAGSTEDGEGAEEEKSVETAAEGDDDDPPVDEVVLPPGLELLNLPVASVSLSASGSGLPSGGNGLPAATGGMPLTLSAAANSTTAGGLPGGAESVSAAEAGGELTTRREFAAVVDKAADGSAGQRAFSQLLDSRLAATPAAQNTEGAGASSTLTAPATAGGGAASAAQATASAQPPMRSAIDTPFRQPGWNDSLGNRVMWMANEKIEKAEIRLNPPTLGPIEVKVKMHGDQASVSFVSHNPAVREALEQAMPRLREMMGDNGLQLAEAEVSDAPPDQRAREGDGEGDGSGRGGRGGGGDGEEADMPQAQSAAVGVGMLDAYA
ncbi:hypothetical protein JCM17961_06730 [Endothiovibrio diazotrophicus]